MNIAVIAPHPDDETLGCGGTLLKHKSVADKIYWILATEAGVEYSEKHIRKKHQEIEEANKIYKFKEIIELKFPVTRLDTVSLSTIIESLNSTFLYLKPEIIYIPFPYDIHSDHQIIFDVVSSCTKWFRIKSLRKILAYETISETEFNIKPGTCFYPNVFVNIEKYIEKKIKIMKCYKSEMAHFPFPRSEENIRALATFRGAMSGFKAAEAFMLLKEIIE